MLEQLKKMYELTLEEGLIVALYYGANELMKTHPRLGEAVTGFLLEMDFALNPPKLQLEDRLGYGRHEMEIDSVTGKVIRTMDVTPDGDMVTIKTNLPNNETDRQVFYKGSDGFYKRFEGDNHSQQGKVELDSYMEVNKN